MAKREGAEPVSSSNKEPVDAHIARKILNTMGVMKYDDKVVYQLLEFIHRYVSETLIDAQEYCSYAGKSIVDGDDIRLAIQSRLNHHYSPPPSRELLMELAEKRNMIPLPPIPSEYGLHLPPPAFQLSSDNILVTSMQEPSSSTVSRPKIPTASTNSASKGQGSRNKSVSKNPIPIKLDTAKRSFDQMS